MFIKYGLPAFAAVCILFAIVHVTGAQQKEARVAPVAAPPKNPFAATVAGSGVVEPRTESIAVGSPLPGVVVEVHVQVGTVVEVGAPLFRLDDRQLQAELRFRESALAAARADLERLERQPRPEQLPVAMAVVNESAAHMTDMEDQMKRTRELAKRNVVAEQEVVTREQQFRMAQAQFNKSKAEFDLLQAGAWDQDKAVAKAAVEQASAQVGQVKTELDRLVVRALVKGEVLKVNVRPGEFVAAPANQGLIILGDVQELHARVDIDEHDIPRFHTGAKAVAMVKGFSQEKYNLRFVRVEPFVIPKKSLTGDNTERVDTRVLQVIYVIEPGARRLYVGQQLDVFVDATDPQVTAQASFRKPL